MDEGWPVEGGERKAHLAAEALGRGDLEEARGLLEEALDDLGERPDLLHVLGVIHLQSGAVGEARPLVERAIALLPPDLPEAQEMAEHFSLTLAMVALDEDEPGEALDIYGRLLERRSSVEVSSALGALLLAMGDLDGAREQISRMQGLGGSGEQATQVQAGAREVMEALNRWLDGSEHPRGFLAAHRNGYCRFFDDHADRLAKEGWIAEAARMRKEEDGRLVPQVPEGARPYAAVRVDLVNPSTGQAGMVGDAPTVVQRRGWEPLARTPVLLPWPDAPFDIAVSTQCPWDHLHVQVLLEGGDAVELVDPVVGEWYRAGFDGRFGEAERGRFHFISDPEPRREHGVVYRVDMGRADAGAVEGLVEMLVPLHERIGIRKVVFGRGHLPLG